MKLLARELRTVVHFDRCGKPRVSARSSSNGVTRSAGNDRSRSRCPGTSARKRPRFSARGECPPSSSSDTQRELPPSTIASMLTSSRTSRMRVGRSRAGAGATTTGDHTARSATKRRRLRAGVRGLCPPSRANQRSASETKKNQQRPSEEARSAPCVSLEGRRRCTPPPGLHRRVGDSGRRASDDLRLDPSERLGGSTAVATLGHLA
jgi:hypothetical protein